ncbi:MAG: DsrE family protein [Candidatus Diapherotrites archaeon]|uniref:DsrE family protein n=1 Tax=Candidatus Iainarchaeum sp. TaxID=3101447 RepID=A0A8T3YIB8_9ARCH|nr:DsrE family protein [Candidatus Diapherotrites archaeon]
MKLAIILNTNEAESVWNAFRLGVTALGKKNSVKIFLLGKGVECQNTQGKAFDVKKMMGAFAKMGGTILACGTCLKTRGQKTPAACSVSTMEELLQAIEWADKIITLG